MLRTTVALLLACGAACCQAATIRVPEDEKTIQSAIDIAKPGDEISVGPGRYRERIALKPNVAIRSRGNNARGEIGLKRAEATIIDGSGDDGDAPGVLMAEGSTLDGLTITAVGKYDQALWQKHHDTHGENLADDEGSVRDEGTVGGIVIRKVNCTVVHNIVHHNGHVGIAVAGDQQRSITPLIEMNFSYRNLGGGIGIAGGASAIVRGNTCSENLRAGIGCRGSAPMIVDNTCSKNIRAGIGCREGATPLVRGNKCFQNRRAGIGCRMQGTAPIIEGNECYQNDMAGIGSRDDAAPIIRDNHCHHNKMAGIGCDGSKPIIVGNQCRENEMAGIGLRGQASATIQDNHCIENKLVAIGVTAQSTARINGNRLTRTGGVPPIIAVKDQSSATILGSEISGGGVAAVLVQGQATISQCTFAGAGEKQGNAVWVWQGSTATVANNSFNGYRAAVNATKSKVHIQGNKVQNFNGPAFVVKDSSSPAHVFGNRAFTKDEAAQVVAIQGSAGVVADNLVVTEEADRQ